MLKIILIGLISAFRSHRRIALAERLLRAGHFGSIRRECLDHVIVLSDGYLRRVLKEYLDYYHESRTHLGLGKDAPEPRAIEAQDVGPVASEPVLGGLHHRYHREAA